MRRLLAGVAFVGLILSLSVHIGALMGFDASTQFPLVWLLHVGMFIVFAPLVLVCRKELGPNPSFSDLRSAFPGWVVFVGVALMIYVVTNFALFIVATQGGNPSIEGGHYLLKDHGHTIREITASEYASFKTNEFRGFSGHWLVFYYVPFAYFLFRKHA
jgi:hypothetical protein